MTRSLLGTRKDCILLAVVGALTVGLWFLPTGFENRLPVDAAQVKARVVAVDNAHVHQYGLVREGEQRVTVQPLSGPFADQTIVADNLLLGKLEMDKVFAPGDAALVVLSLREGKIVSAVAEDHWRLGLQGLLLGIFALALVAYAGVIGVKDLL